MIRIPGIVVRPLQRTEYDDSTYLSTPDAAIRHQTRLIVLDVVWYLFLRLYHHAVSATLPSGFVKKRKDVQKSQRLQGLMPLLQLLRLRGSQGISLNAEAIRERVLGNHSRLLFSSTTTDMFLLIFC